MPLDPFDLDECAPDIGHTAQGKAQNDPYNVGAELPIRLLIQGVIRTMPVTAKPAQGSAETVGAVQRGFETLCESGNLALVASGQSRISRTLKFVTQPVVHRLLDYGLPLPVCGMTDADGRKDDGKYVKNDKTNLGHEVSY
ncbi:hypothetical protein [Pseudarthrobacter siccitolerans]